MKHHARVLLAVVIGLVAPGCGKAPDASGSLTLAPPSGTSLPNGQVGEVYSQSVTVAGGAAPVTVEGVTVPEGLTFTPTEQGGAIGGAPARVGSSELRVRATDAHGKTAEAAYTIVVEERGQLAILPAALPNALVGAEYEARLTVVGGIPPCTWTVRGPLPAGIVLEPATGAESTEARLHGRPISQGDATFTVTATDANGQSGTTTFTLSVPR